MQKKIIIGIIIVILACCGIYAGFTQANTTSNGNTQIDVSNLENEDNFLVNQEQTVANKLYTTDKSDTNTILVENNSTLTIKDSVVNKTGDASSKGDSVDFYGSNSALLVKKGSRAEITNVNINTNSDGSNAIFVTNAEFNGDESSANQNMGEGGQAPDQPGMGNGGQPTDMQGIGSGQPDAMPNGNGGQPDTMPENNGEKAEGIQNDSNYTANNKVNPEGKSNEDYSEGGAQATVKDVTINTYKDKSRGLDATYGGIINAENVNINTRGGSCAALATDRGEGTVTATDCQLNTGVDNGTGRGSPCIYSTGNITATSCKGTAYVSQIACIEGKNSITLTDCDLNCFAGGNREENGEFVDLGGIFIYQSMSGDANVGTATLNATNSKLSIDSSSKYYETAPMLHITNTKAIVNLENCELSFGSGILLDVSGQSQWGTVGSNGGDLELNLNNEKLEGNIIVDEISSLQLNMTGTEYSGSINSNDTYGNTSVSIDSGSTWTLTGDSHITNLENSGNIDYKTFTLYINGKAYNSEHPYSN